MRAEVKNNAERHRYEILVGGEVAGFAAYRPRDDAMVFTHTEIDEAHEGQGLGSALAKAALDDVRASGAAVVPLCPFIKGYIERHPEYGDLVTT